MKGIFTILNYYFSPGRRAAQWPLATAPAAVGDRNLQQDYIHCQYTGKRNNQKQNRYIKQETFRHCSGNNFRKSSTIDLPLKHFAKRTVGPRDLAVLSVTESTFPLVS